MIPTIIIVNDRNKALTNLGQLLQNLIRTYNRTSVEGEKLYGIFEGILYFDEFGTRQFKRQDDYADVLPLVLAKLGNLPAKDKVLLKDYLQGQGIPLVVGLTKGEFDAPLQEQLDQHIREYYG